MFDPMIAGVTIPGIVLVLIGSLPHIDRNPSNAPEDRKSHLHTIIHSMFWAVLVIIGSGQGSTSPILDTGLHGSSTSRSITVSTVIHRIAIPVPTVLAAAVGFTSLRRRTRKAWPLVA